MKVVVVGWEAVSWTALAPLIAAGRLPQLQRMLAGGGASELAGLGRLGDPVITWTSLSTGKRPSKHRVLSGIEPAPRESGLRPIHRAARHASTFWEIANQAGGVAHAINWPASHPPIGSGAGTIVSDLFFTAAASASAVWPPQVLGDLQPLRLSAHEIDNATIAPLLPRPLPPGLAAAARKFIAAAASVQAVTTMLLEQRPGDVLAVRFPALPRAMSASPVAMGGAMQFLDVMLGRLRDLAGPQCESILVAVDPSHGGTIVSTGSSDAQPTPTRSVFDIAPTLLVRLGIPPGADMDGRASEWLLGTLRPIEPRISWEPPAAALDRDEADESENSVSHLLALGYRESPDRYAQHAIQRYRRHQLLALAIAHLDADQPHEAARLLERIALERRGDSVAIRSVLAEALFFSDRSAECHKLIDALIAEGVDTPLAHAALGALDARERRVDQALQHLWWAQQHGSGDPFVLESVGRVLLQLGDDAAAERAMGAALALAPGRAGALESLAQLALRRGEVEIALQHADAAIAARPDGFAGHYHRGIALRRLGRAGDAVAALMRAAALDRRGSPAVLRQLADALEQSGDIAGAQRQRFLAQQSRLFRQQRQAGSGIMR